MTPDTLLLPFIWLLNGFLALAYLTVEHITVVMLAFPLFWLISTTEKAQRPWMMGASAMALAGAMFGSLAVGLWLLLMASASVLTIRLEKFNPHTLRWRVAGGIAAYALIGLGAAIYKLLAPSMMSDSFFALGQVYLSTIVGVATIIAPVGFLGMLVQAIWAHPPLEQSPEEMFTQIRTRGKR
jgi:hypothetical protein